MMSANFDRAGYKAFEGGKKLKPTGAEAKGEMNEQKERGGEGGAGRRK